MSRFMFSIVILLFLAIIFTPVAGQLLAADSSLPEPTIHLKQYSFDPLAVEPQLAASMKTSMSGGETFTALVQFSGPVHANWKEQVESAGVRLYGYIPDYAFIARTDYSAAESIRSLPFIRWVGGYHPAYAIDRELISVQAAAQGADDTLSVKTLPNTDLDALATTIDSLGGSVLGQS